MASAKLVVQAPGGQRHDFPLLAPAVTIGRSAQCDLVLDYGFVSRQHSRIERTKDSYLLIDCGSTNGTYINGRRIGEMQLLTSGDEIAIGDVVITFLDSSVEEIAPTLFRPMPADSPIRCDSSSWRVWVRDTELEVRLSLQEFEVLSLLTSRYGRVCTREELGTAIWGRGNYDLNMLHRLVHRLKRKLGPDLGAMVVSVAKRGYKVELPSSPAADVSTSSELRTILFTDIVGHGEMMTRLGDEDGRRVLREHERLTRDVLGQHGGVEVKALGDGFMASFSSVSKAFQCAAELQRAFGQRNESADEQLHVRVGLNAGEPIEEEGDFFTTVILAARIAEQADGGEILLPEPVRHLLSGKQFSFAERGEVILKGFDDAVRLYELRWRTEGAD
jgi:class 3 adenylate cyclase